MALTFSNIINIFATPTEVFQNIKTAPKWLITFMFICFVSLVYGFIMLPFTQKIMEGTFLSKMSEEQVQLVTSTISRYRVFSMLLIPMTFLIKWLFIALFLYLGAILFDAEQPNFKSIYASVVHAELILLLMATINLIFLLIKGIDAINNITDLQTIIGLDFAIADKSQNVLLFNFLNNYNIFSIWYIIVLTTGISVICQLKKWKSAVLVSSVWFLSIGIQFAFGLLSQNIGQMMGR